MQIFFDTEFTQFRAGQLLSVGLVSDADDELVVEIHDPLRHARASQFCQGVVIPQFGAVPARKVSTDLDLGRVVAAWLGQFEPPLTLYYDYKLDRHFLIEALSGAEDWRVLEPQVSWVNVADVARSAECLAAHDRYFEGKGFPGRHHPLVDAKAMRERWRAYARAASQPRQHERTEPGAFNLRDLNTGGPVEALAKTTKATIDEGCWRICPKCFEGSGKVSEMEMQELPDCSGHCAHFRYCLSCPVCNHSDIY